MKLLDAVNTVLPYLGEHPVTDIDTAHPTVDLIVAAINRHREAFLSEGWWFNEGTVTVELRGSCSGCPSSIITLKAGIEGLLKRMVPEVQEVVADSL